MRTHLGLVSQPLDRFRHQGAVRRQRARIFIALTAVVLPPLLGACTTSEPRLHAATAQPGPVAKSPYYDDVVAAGKSAVSDFERKVFADGTITRGEYEMSVQKLVDCAKAKGVTIAATPDAYGLSTYSLTASAVNDQVMTKCSAGTTLTIEGLYAEITKNPTRADWEALVTECLVSTGLAPSGYTKRQYVKDRIGIKQGQVNRPQFPFSTADSRFNACEQDPSSAEL
ncbi:MAG: hypothetical protein L0H78_02005 [Humibacillus sp.]|nr:hypothetical protein [Humibacillus sp.]